MNKGQGVFKLAEGVSHQSMGPDEDTVVLSFASGYLYTCNETTARFLQSLDGCRTLGEIVDEMADQYDVARQKLQDDLENLLDDLLREKLIVPADIP